MADISHLARMHEALTAIVQDLSITWPKHDIACVEEEIGHREYGDALENLTAFSLQNGRGFNSSRSSKSPWRWR